MCPSDDHGSTGEYGELLPPTQQSTSAGASTSGDSRWTNIDIGDEEKVAILARLTDAHAHPTDVDDYAGPSGCGVEAMKVGQVCAMASTLINQDLVKELQKAFPDRFIPCFGVHPWFIHPISLQPPSALPSKEDHYRSILLSSPTDESTSVFDDLLPHFRNPISLTTVLSELEANLLAHPTAMVGEVGLDRSFRIPERPTPRARKSILATPVAHQVVVLEKQLEIAVRLRRNVSFHSVRASQDAVECLGRMKKMKGWEKINVCMHSFGGSPQTIKQIQKAHPNAFFSFATAISGRSPKFFQVLQAVEENRLLVESDYPAVRLLDAQMWEIVEAVCQARGWTLDKCVDVLEANWKRFESQDR